MKIKFPAVVLFCLFVLNMHNVVTAQGQITVYQREYLELQIKQSVKSLFIFWEEERYAEELFRLGSHHSQDLVGQVDFAGRMNRNGWSINGLDSRITNIDLQAVTLAFVDVTLTMVKKNNRNKKYLIKTVLTLTYEDINGESAWRYNLLRLMAFPYLF